MKSKLFWTGVLAVVLGLAAAVVNCQGEKEGHSTFEARDPVWNDNNSGADFCHDGNDNDGDGFADAAGVPPGCTPGAGCIYEADPECQVAGSTGEAECSDNLDNDGDGFFDKVDDSCFTCSSSYSAQFWSESVFDIGSNCCDGMDNDCDGLVDESDDACYVIGLEGTTVVTDCNDGVDNDADTLIDLADPGCTDECDAAETCDTLPKIDSGDNGICDSTAAGDDVQVIQPGRGLANAVCITAGANATCDTVAAGGDDVLGAAPNCVSAGPDGVCNTTATPDDVQDPPVGQGQANQTCINGGSNCTLDSVIVGDDQ
jgi:hypothetical protein